MPSAPPSRERSLYPNPPSSPRLLVGGTSCRESIRRNRYQDGERSRMPCMRRAASSFVSCGDLEGQRPRMRSLKRITPRLYLPPLSPSPPVLHLSRVPSPNQKYNHISLVLLPLQGIPFQQALTVLKFMVQMGTSSTSSCK